MTDRTPFRVLRREATARRGIRVAPAALSLLLGLAAPARVMATDVPQTVAERFAAMPGLDDVVARPGWYRPQERVVGAARTGRELPRAKLASVDFSRAMQVARDYDSDAVVVLRRGRLLAEQYSAGHDAGTRFSSQSMHRALLALVALAAVEDGRVRSLDEPAARFLSEWRGDSRAGISFADLLLGQSGLAEPPFALRADSPGMLLFIGDDLPGLVLSQPQDAPRGTRFRAGGVESQALGLALERALGESYASYLSRRIWRRIGAGDAFVQRDREGGSTRAFCCFEAAARDYARIGQLVLERGRWNGRRVLSDASIERLLAPAPLDERFGMYWYRKPIALVARSAAPGSAPVQLTALRAEDTVFAGGRGGQRIFVIPSREAVVVRLGRVRNDFDDGRFLNPFIEALDALPP